jgi:transcriptional regulator with XRE-family HTH domain
MAGKQTFGSFLRKLRLEAGYGLRRFATEAGFQPSNLSNIERGKQPPPRDRERLEEIADTLGLVEDSSERRSLFDLAAEERDAALPADVAHYARSHRAVPVLLRAAEAKKLTDEDFQKLTEYINEHL